MVCNDAHWVIHVQICLMQSHIVIQCIKWKKKGSLMSGSSHIQSVLIGVEYCNYRRTLDVYLLFAIWMGQIQLKLIYIFVTYVLASL